jgi:stage V sporulation protein SpoVS
MQKEAQIEDMMRRGIPLGAVAAALASPETAERIAILEAATTGSMSALEAARLNVQRAGQDLTLLDGLRMAGKALPARTGRSAITGAELEDERDEQEEEVAVNGNSPLALARRR